MTILLAPMMSSLRCARAVGRAPMGACMWVTSAPCAVMQAAPPDADRSWVFSTSGAGDDSTVDASAPGSMGGNFAIKFAAPDAARAFQLAYNAARTVRAVGVWQLLPMTMVAAASPGVCLCVYVCVGGRGEVHARVGAATTRAARVQSNTALTMAPDEGTEAFAHWVDSVLYTSRAIARSEVRPRQQQQQRVPRPASAALTRVCGGGAQRVHGDGFMSPGAFAAVAPHVKALQLRPGVTWRRRCARAA